MHRPLINSAARLLAPAVLLGVTLAGCASTAEPTTAPTTTESASPSEPTVEPTTPVVTETFAMPADCTEILPPANIAKFESDEIVLLAGPGGKYGDELITDPTPETVAGGISCYFGVDNEDINALSVSYLVSAVSLDATTRAEVISDLTAQGLVQSTDERGDISFGVLGGSAGQTTANYNIVAVDSWISVISSKGGEKAFLSAVKLADAVHLNTYE
ncbi:MAG: hypothetical protein NWS64_03535 [Microbacteriaceae bacterium]|nr:hypothetical protein [Microbacteriaceae bacterium]